MYKQHEVLGENISCKDETICDAAAVGTIRLSSILYQM